MMSGKEYTLDDHVRERESSDEAFRTARARHRERYEYARQLIQARLERKLTQEELATALGTTHSAVARMESGRFLPRTDTLRRLADVLGVSRSLAAPRGSLTLTLSHCGGRGNKVDFTAVDEGTTEPVCGGQVNNTLSQGRNSAGCWPENA